MNRVVNRENVIPNTERIGVTVFNYSHRSQISRALMGIE